MPDTSPLAPSTVLTALIKPTEKNKATSKATHENPRSHSIPHRQMLLATNPGENVTTIQRNKDLLAKRALGERLLLRRSSNKPRKSTRMLPAIKAKIFRVAPRRYCHDIRSLSRNPLTTTRSLRLQLRLILTTAPET